MTRILVVDDVKLFRHLEATVLGWRGYTIEEASNGTEAIEKVKAHPPDLVLVDLVMPGLSGHEVCRQIKTHPDYQSIPVIIVASSNQDQDIRAAVQAGCDDYLTKPLDDASLVRKVEDLLGNVDRRRFPRIPASLQISFEDFKGIFFQYTRDLSRTGVFVEMEDPLPVDSCLRLSFSLPNPFRQPVFAYGRVVRQVLPEGDHPGGMGVRFIHIDENNRRMIDALVAAQPQLEAAHQTGVFSRVSFQPEEGACADAGAQLKPLLEERDQLRTALEQLQLDHLRLSTILAFTESLHAEESPQRVLQVASDVLHDLIGAASFGIFLNDPSRKVLVPVASRGLPGTALDHLVAEGPIAQALQQRTLQVPAPPWPLAHTGSKVQVVVPLLCGETILGVITVHDLFAQKSALNVNDNHLLQMLGNHLGLALVNSVARLQMAGKLDVGAILKALA